MIHFHWVNVLGLPVFRTCLESVTSRLQMNHCTQCDSLTLLFSSSIPPFAPLPLPPLLFVFQVPYFSQSSHLDTCREIPSRALNMYQFWLPRGWILQHQFAFLLLLSSLPAHTEIRPTPRIHLITSFQPTLSFLPKLILPASLISQPTDVNNTSADTGEHWDQSCSKKYKHTMEVRPGRLFRKICGCRFHSFAFRVLTNILKTMANNTLLLILSQCLLAAAPSHRVKRTVMVHWSAWAHREYLSSPRYLRNTWFGQSEHF